MKSIFILLSLVLFAFNAEANWHSLTIDGEDSIQGVFENPKFKKQTVKSKLKVDYWLQIAQVYSVPEEFQCADKDIAKVKVTSPTGVVFYMIYTQEDYCDGGNSIGIVLDEQLKTLGRIEDSTFYQ